MSAGAVRTPSMRTVMAQLRRAESVDVTGVNRALDAALADGSITRTERSALQQLLQDSSFSSAPVKARLETLLALPDDKLALLAHRLTRADGVIDLQDARALVDVARGTQKGVVSLRALHVGAKMTAAARGAGETSVLHAEKQARLDRQPLRTFTLDGAPGVDVVSRGTLSRAASPAPPSVKDVNADALQAALGKAATDRLALLKSGAPLPSTPRVMPEDGSARITAFHMGYGLGADQAGMNFPLQMAQVGKLEGFSVVLRVPGDMADDLRAQVKKEKITNVQLMGVTGEGDFWSEDQGDLDVTGNVRVPAPAHDLEAMREAAYRARVARLYPADAAAVMKMPWDKLQPLLQEKYPDALFSMVGAVADRKSHEVLAAAALGRGTRITASLTHLEGGNVLTGTRTDGSGYALVGRDSLVHSRVILEKDLGRKVTDHELRRFVAFDLGIPAENVVAVEQPRDFHIDMHMVPIRPGVVLMNDPVEAARLSAQWELEDKEKLAPAPPPPGAGAEKVAAYKDELRFHRELMEDVRARHADTMKQAVKQAAFEARTRRDLEQAGLTVVTAPAVFGSGHFQSDNFLNAEQGTNPRGERFYIALGGDPRAERTFLSALEKLGTGIARVHLLDRRFTQSTLSAGGGISCRCKAEGTLAG